MVRASRTDRVPDTATEEDEDEDVEGSAISGSLSPRMQQLAATTTMPASPSSIATYPMRASTSQRCGCLWSAKLVGTPIEFGQPGQVWAWSASERAHAHNHEMDEHVELISDDYDEPSANTGAARPRPVVGRAGMSAATAVNGTAVDATSLRISGNLRAPPASDAAPSYLPSAMLLQPQEVNHYPIRPTQFTNDNIHSITTNSHHPIPIINGHPPIIINGSLHHGIDNSAHHHGHHHSIDNRGHHSSISANHHLARPAQLAFQGRRDQAFNNHQPPHFAAHGHAHVAYEHPIIPLPSVTLNAADLYAALALSTARMERLAELRPMLATAKSRSPERHGDERPREP